MKCPKCKKLFVQPRYPYERIYPDGRIRKYYICYHCDGRFYTEIEKKNDKKS